MPIRVMVCTGESEGFCTEELMSLGDLKIALPEPVQSTITIGVLALCLLARKRKRA